MWSPLCQCCINASVTPWSNDHTNQWDLESESKANTAFDCAYIRSLTRYDFFQYMSVRVIPCEKSTKVNIQSTFTENFLEITLNWVGGILNETRCRSFLKLWTPNGRLLILFFLLCSVYVVYLDKSSFNDILYTVKPVQSGHPRGMAKWPLNTLRSNRIHVKHNKTDILCRIWKLTVYVQKRAQN